MDAFGDVAEHYRKFANDADGECVASRGKTLQDYIPADSRQIIEAEISPKAVRQGLAGSTGRPLPGI
jgi:hypothetical protein